jgi:hypothetical protein
VKVLACLLHCICVSAGLTSNCIETVKLTISYFGLEHLPYAIADYALAFVLLPSQNSILRLLQNQALMIVDGLQAFFFLR